MCRSNGLPDGRLLWADDDQECVEALWPSIAGLLKGYHHAPNALSAADALKARKWAIVLVDLQMPPGLWGGLELIRQSANAYRNTPFLVVSGRGTLRECIEAVRAGAQDYVHKEEACDELPSAVSKALAWAERHRPLSDYEQIRSLELNIHQCVMDALRVLAAESGADVFRTCVPPAISLKTYQRMLEAESGSHEQFLDIADLREIIEKNWNRSERLKVLESILRPRNKDERTKWLVEFNEMRKKVAHPTRGGLSDGERVRLASMVRLVERWKEELKK